MAQVGIKDFNQWFWLTRSDFKLRDQGTALGFFWTLLNPLVMFLVLYTVFSAWFEKHIPNYWIYLLVGIVHWNFFSLATSNSVNIVERKRHFLKSFALPIYLIPFSAVSTVFVSYLLESLIVVLISAGTVGITLQGLAWYIFFLFVHLLFALSVSLILSVGYIFLRDIAHLWAIALRIGFFVTPVFYPLTIVSENKLLILKLNPLYHLFNYSREALTTGTIVFDWQLAYLLGVVALLFLTAISIYRKKQRQLVERL